MHRGGINTPEAALEIISQSKIRSRSFIVSELALFVILALLLQGDRAISFNPVRFFLSSGLPPLHATALGISGGNFPSQLGL